jgi:serine/threonine protein kinase
VAGELPSRPDAALPGLTPGTVVSGYRVESRIGAGGMAVVFRARDESLGRLVALKVLAPALVDDQAFRERFIRESRAAAAVDHPYIIPVYSAGEADGVLYLAMRYVSGGDLRSVCSSAGPLTGERAASLLSPVASALDAAHAAGLVHRDVKPANILLDVSPGRPDHPYLSDFGLAKGSAAASGLTGTGQFIGTPNYSAPEQIAGQPVGPLADQYALACVTYTMLTGRLPFERDTPMSVLWAHMNAALPPVAASRPDLPAAVDQVLARALAKAPGDRFPSCGDFAEAFRGALGAGSYAFPAAGSGSRPASPPPSVPPARQAPSVPSAPSPQPAAASGQQAPSAGEPWAAGAGAGPAAWPAHTITAQSPLPGRVTAPPGAGGAYPPPPNAAFPGDGRTVPWPGPAGRSRRRTWIYVGAGIVAAAGITAGVLAAIPGSPAPVLQPTGLAAQSESTSTVGLTWSGPASGPLPDSYEILENGREIGSVPGSTTTYSAGRLQAATPYAFEVVAVRGGKRSPVSADASTRTQAPPLSAAVLKGTSTVTYKMISLEPPAPSWTQQPGDTWQDSWTFTPVCSSGACDVDLSGKYVNNPFTMHLKRSGASYTGSAPLSQPSTCSSSGNSPLTTTLSVTVTVSAARGQGAQWTATALSGNAELLILASTACHGTTAEYTITTSG